MNDRKFSLKAEHVLRCAQAAAGELGHGYVGCEHLLLAMLREEDDAACRALNASGVYEPAVRERMIEKLGRGTAERSTVQGLTPHARCAVELAVGEALRGAAERSRRDTCCSVSCATATIWPCGCCDRWVWIPKSCTATRCAR